MTYDMKNAISWHPYYLLSSEIYVLRFQRIHVTGPMKIDHVSKNYTELYFR